jgi:hypothetical protein
MKIYLICKLTLAVLAIQMLSGCGYIFLGTEEIDAWGFKAKFASGVTARAGINSIDQVDDNQGVNTRRQHVTRGERY